MRVLIHNRAPEHELVAAARAGGLRSMREDGERLVREGITSLEEVIRVTREPDGYAAPGSRSASGTPMPAYRFEALDAAGKSLQRPARGRQRQAPRGRSCAPASWCRWR